MEEEEEDKEDKEVVVVVVSPCFGMSYLLIFSDISQWKKTGYRLTDGPTDGQTPL